MIEYALQGPRMIAPREADPLPLGPGELRVRVDLCGVCASELHNWEDAPQTGRVMGHEVVGTVIESHPSVTGFSAGRRVTGLAQNGFAEACVFDESRCLPIPADAPPETMIGEPISCVISAMDRTHIGPDTSVALIGLGIMGLLCLQVARAVGAKQIVAIDPRADMREMALRLGASEAIAPDDVPDGYRMTQWSQVGQRRGFDVVIEAAGVQPALTMAGELVTEHGHLLIVGWHRGGPRSMDLEMWGWKAFDVSNAHERRPDAQMGYMRRGLDMVRAGTLDIGGLVTHRLPMSQINRAFELLVEKPPGFVKAVVVAEG